MNTFAHVGTRARFLGLLVAVLAAGCGGTVDPPAMIDGGSTDASDGALDAPPAPDAGPICMEDADCDDGAYCNGAETCTSGACVDGAAPCSAAMCDEGADTCSCASPDDDSDGSNSIACGGDDCDDGDPARYPAAIEICDLGDVDEDCNPTTYGSLDVDVDGVVSIECCNDTTCGTDCDDASASTYPAATETCDGLDNSCDGAIDEGVLRTFLPDADGDGFGVIGGTPVMACFPPALYAETRGDCDDDPATGSAIHPGAVDTCDLAMLDEDCNGLANDPVGGCACVVGVPDRMCILGGLCASGTESCVDGTWSECSIRPEVEICNGVDEDCNGVVDNGTTVPCFADDDNDGYAIVGAAMASVCPDPTRVAVGECPTGTTNRAPVAPVIDCAEMDSTRAPGLAEICNGIDEDCDGVVDDGVTVVCYADVDGDEFAAFATPARALCPDVGRVSVGTCPVGYTNAAPVAGTIDCDDAAITVFPGASEICNGIDEDCDTMRDEGTTITCYLDSDADTYSPPGAMPTAVCAAPFPAPAGTCPSFYTSRVPAGVGTIDCNDLDPTRSPGVPEICNGIDEDCDGTPDDGTTIACYVDSDNDTYSAAGATLMAVCPAPLPAPAGTCPSLYTNRAPAGVGAIDCNDLDSTRSPAAVEICDGIDQDCDGTPDDGRTVTCYVDADNDTYAPASAIAQQRCPDTLDVTRIPVNGCEYGYTNRSPATASDCNDGAASVRPTGTEVCNGADDDCDGGIDEGTLIRYYRDGDNDLHGNSAIFVDRCTPQSGYVEDNTDCNDSNRDINPLEPEVCNCIDDDCDMVADDSLAPVCVFRDADRDDYGDPAFACDAMRCLPSTGPLCDPQYARVGGDCNDASPAVHPGAGEICLNMIDDDCNGLVDDGAPRWYRDNDGDTYGDDADVMVACADPDGVPGDLVGLWVNRGGDCDVVRRWVHPNAPEECDGLDTDCDVAAVQLGEVGNARGLNHALEDNDGDGRGDVGCMPPPPVTRTALTDCNDAEGAVYPSAPELIGNGVDNDCDGDEICYVDVDGDSHRTILPTTVDSIDADCADPGEALAGQLADDCNDAAADVYGFAPEIVGNDVDNDCDGGEICYQNTDGDPRRTALTIVSANTVCTDAGEARATLQVGDCNDGDAAIYLGAPEGVDNGVDNDCDLAELCYADADSDSHRHIDTALRVSSSDLDCLDAGEGSTGEPADDCDDYNASRFPGNPEIVDNGVDNDCIGSESCYADADSDNHRSTFTSLRVSSSDLDCLDAGEGSTGEPADDCDDYNASRFPGNPEVVDNGVDNDCIAFESCYVDADSDGHRHMDTTLRVLSSDLDCLDAGEGRSAPSELADDCEDTNPNRYPGNADDLTGGANTGNGVDNDCDGAELCYVDADDDGYRAQGGSGCTATSNCSAGQVCVPGQCHQTVTSSADVDCLDGTEAAASLPASDCADTDAQRNPGLSDGDWRRVGNEVDNDCNGGEVCFLDSDDDNYRPSPSGAACTQDPDNCSGTSVCIGPLLRCRPTIVSTNSTCADAREAPSSALATDCCDANAIVRPDQTGWFTSAYSTPGCPSNFDYDCMAGPVQQYTACTGSPLCTTCPGAGTWLACATPPACGVAGNRWISCPGTCASRTQACH